MNTNADYLCLGLYSKIWYVMCLNEIKTKPLFHFNYSRPVIIYYSRPSLDLGTVRECGCTGASTTLGHPPPLAHTKYFLCICVIVLY